MILKLKDEQLIIISEDSMDTAYLKYIFSNEIEVSKETIIHQSGFNIAGEQEVRVTLNRMAEDVLRND